MQCQTLKQLIWAMCRLKRLGFNEEKPMKLWYNNQRAIALIKNPENYLLTKLIDAQYHYVR